MRPLCQICAVKYGKSLWQGNCCCDGSVPVYYKGPDPLIPRQTKQEPVKLEEMKEKTVKIGKKERQRLERLGIHL